MTTCMKTCGIEKAAACGVTEENNMVAGEESVKGETVMKKKTKSEETLIGWYGK